MVGETNVAVIGAGYVGLVTGACLSFVGHRVACVDKDEERISRLDRGEMPVYEPGLQEIVSRGARSGGLTFANGIDEVVREAGVVFIAVDTSRGGDGSADLSSVGNVARSIGRSLAGIEDLLVVANKSLQRQARGAARALLQARDRRRARVPEPGDSQSPAHPRG